MSSHVAVTSISSAVVPGERVIMATPKSSVVAIVVERVAWVEFVSKVITAFG